VTGETFLFDLGHAGPAIQRSLSAILRLRVCGWMVGALCGGRRPNGACLGVAAGQAPHVQASTGARRPMTRSGQSLGIGLQTLALQIAELIRLALLKWRRTSLPDSFAERSGRPFLAWALRYRLAVA